MSTNEGDIVEQKIKIISSSKKSCKTYEFTDEDHTLGNSLRYALMRNPKVDFCGYTVPHPMENKMNVRLQTKNGLDATEVMEESLDVLVDIFDLVDMEFKKASTSFEKKTQSS